MNVHPDVNFEELARSTDDFNGAQLKAVCVEAGMLALRRDATEVCIYATTYELNNQDIMTNLACNYGLTVLIGCFVCLFLLVFLTTT